MEPCFAVHDSELAAKSAADETTAPRVNGWLESHPNCLPHFLPLKNYVAAPHVGHVFVTSIAAFVAASAMKPDRLFSIFFAADRISFASLFENFTL